MNQRGRGRGGNISSKNDHALVRELYPKAPPTQPLHPDLTETVPKFNAHVLHMMSNFAVKPISADSLSPGFFINRYSDRYTAPAKLPALLTYTVDPRRLPAELAAGGVKAKSKKSGATASEIRAKRALDKLSKMTDDEKEEDPSSKKARTEDGDSADEGKDEEEERQVNPNPELEEDEEVDEELDEGNDYDVTYFDPGDRYGESEDELEDNSVY